MFDINNTSEEMPVRESEQMIEESTDTQRTEEPPRIRFFIVNRVASESDDEEMEILNATVGRQHEDIRFFNDPRFAWMEVGINTADFNNNSDEEATNDEETAEDVSNNNGHTSHEDMQDEADEGSGSRMDVDN
uniref:Ras-associating domain-containing protein n=1 Tax=Steinernema glaseri TaxID=37863 RepID=A0A1I8A8G3_9BILA